MADSTGNNTQNPFEQMAIQEGQQKPVASALPVIPKPVASPYLNGQAPSSASSPSTGVMRAGNRTFPVHGMDSAQAQQRVIPPAQQQAPVSANPFENMASQEHAQVTAQLKKGQPPASVHMTDAERQALMGGNWWDDQSPTVSDTYNWLNKKMEDAYATAGRVLNYGQDKPVLGTLQRWATKMMGADVKYLATPVNTVGEMMAAQLQATGREPADLVTGLRNHDYNQVGKALLGGMMSDEQNKRTSEQHPYMAGVGGGAGHFAGQMLSPTNLAIMVAMPEAKAFPILSKILKVGFELQMTGQAMAQVADLAHNWADMSKEQKIQALTELPLNVGMMVWGALSGNKEAGEELNKAVDKKTKLRPTTKTIAGVSRVIPAAQQEGASATTRLMSHEAEVPGMKTASDVQQEGRPAGQKQAVSVLSQVATDKKNAHLALSRGEAAPAPITGTQAPGEHITPDKIWEDLQETANTTYNKARQISQQEQADWQSRYDAAKQAHRDAVDRQNSIIDAHNADEENTPKLDHIPYDETDNYGLGERPKTYDELKTDVDNARQRLGRNNADTADRQRAKDVDLPKAEKAMDGWFKNHEDAISPAEYQSAKSLWSDSERFKEIATNLRGKLAKNTLTGNDIRGLEAVVNGKAIARRGAAGDGTFQRLLGPEAIQNLNEVAKLFDPLEPTDPRLGALGGVKSFGMFLARHAVTTLLMPFLGASGLVGGEAARIGMDMFLNHVMFDPEFGHTFRDYTNSVKDAMASGAQVPAKVYVAFKNSLQRVADAYKASKFGSEKGAVGAAVAPARTGPTAGKPTAGLASPKFPKPARPEVSPNAGTASQPENDVHAVANEYNASQGRPALNTEKVGLAPNRAEIADQFDAMEHDPEHPSVKQSYAALLKELLAQKQALEAKGYKFELSATDPYKSFEEMRDDVLNNKRIKVWTGGNALREGHPLSEPIPGMEGWNGNDVLRGVHDVMGHVGGGHDFSETGEENAYNLHRQTFSKEAIPALTTETRGQTSWFFNNRGVREGAPLGKFADQKAGLLPQFIGHRTGKPVTLSYVRNPEKAPDMGERFLQHIEPAGRYLNEGTNAPKGWDSGTVHFENPLVLPWGEGYQSGKNWKNVLSERFGGKTGKALSNALRAAGYDGIITLRPDGKTTDEIVDLGGKKPAVTAESLATRYGTTKDVFSHEASYVLPDGRIVGLPAGVTHDAAIGEKPSSNARVGFINDQNVLRIRYRMSRAGEEVAVTMPKGGVTQKQLNQIRYAADAKIGRMVIETADRENPKFEVIDEPTGAKVAAAVRRVGGGVRSEVEPGGKVSSQEIADYFNANRGFTLNGERGFMRDKSGYSVAGEHPELDHIIPGQNITPEAVEEYRNRPDVKEALKDPRNSIGGWFYKGNAHLEVSRLYQDRDEAIATGKRLNQNTIFDHSTKNEIPTGGNAADKAAAAAAGGAMPSVDIPTTGGTAAGAAQDTAYFQQAQRELPNGSISDWAQRAQELKDQGAKVAPAALATIDPKEQVGRELVNQIRLRELAREQNGPLTSELHGPRISLSDWAGAMLRRFPDMDLKELGKLWDKMDVEDEMHETPPSRLPGKLIEGGQLSNEGLESPEDFNFGHNATPAQASTTARPIGSTVELMHNPLEVTPSNEENVRTIDVAQALNNYTTERLPQLELGEATPEEMVARAKELMEDEARYQLAQNNSGTTWYTEQMDEHDRIAQEMRPALKNPTKLSLFKFAEAILSSGQKPYRNFTGTMEAWDNFEKTGKFSRTNPKTKKSWGPRQVAAYGNAFDMLNQLLKSKGQKGAVKWLMEEHPVSELKQYNKNVSGKKTDLRPGVIILGEKRGPFAQNLHKMETAFTADMWVSRSWNRWMGTLDVDFNEDEESKSESDTPRNDQERGLMRQSFAETADKLKLSTSSLQAVLWYYEQALYTAHGTPKESWSFSAAAQRAQAEEAAEQTQHQMTSLAGERVMSADVNPQTDMHPELRGTPQPKPLRPDGTIDESQLGPFADWANANEKPEGMLTATAHEVAHAILMHHAGVSTKEMRVGLGHRPVIAGKPIAEGFGPSPMTGVSGGFVHPGNGWRLAFDNAQTHAETIHVLKNYLTQLMAGRAVEELMGIDPSATATHIQGDVQMAHSALKMHGVSSPDLRDAFIDKATESAKRVLRENWDTVQHVARQALNHYGSDPIDSGTFHKYRNGGVYGQP